MESCSCFYQTGDVEYIYNVTPSVELKSAVQVGDPRDW